MKIYTDNLFLHEALSRQINIFPAGLREADITILDTTSPVYVPDEISLNPGTLVYVVSNSITAAARALYARKLRRGFFISLQMSVNDIAVVLRRALMGEPPPGPRESDELLTQLEINVVFFLSLGLSTHKCALLLKMTTSVLSGHKRSAMRKLGLNSDMELWRFMAPVAGPSGMATTAALARVR
jgi:DNA-binding CsgD family transcriptional regulator